MLANLILADLPLEALVSLKHAINDEILRRKKQNYIERRLQKFQRLPIASPYQLPELDEAIDYLVNLNRNALLSLPGKTFHQDFHDRLRYFPCILVQDWTHLLPSMNNDSTNFYVYAHVDPRQAAVRLPGLDAILHGIPFYIGKGIGKRAWDLKRNEGHGKKIKQIRDAGFPDSSIIQVIADGLSERDALILEAKLIYIMGSIYDETITGCLFNLANSMRPLFTTSMQRLPTKRSFSQKRSYQVDNGGQNSQDYASEPMCESCD